MNRPAPGPISLPAPIQLSNETHVADAPGDASDEAQVQEFVKKYQKLVVGTCYHFVRDIDDAHDIAQEVFLAALSIAPAIVVEAEWRAWLYRSASRRSLNVLRARKRRSWIQSLWGHSRDGKRLENVAGAERIRPDRALENAELQKAIDAAIAALPQRQRIAFTLHRSEELGSSEIAAIMRLRSNAVDALLHRARVHLRKSLLKHYREFIDQ